LTENTDYGDWELAFGGLNWDASLSTRISYYAVFGKMCMISIYAIGPHSSSASNGVSVSVNLPITPVTTGIIPCVIDYVGSSSLPAGLYTYLAYSANTTTAYVHYRNSSGLSQTLISNNIPALGSRYTRYFAASGVYPIN
jgi:hypothetical protein